jgi:acetyltransferase-like isoleucine patch superfamily enzyme
MSALKSRLTRSPVLSLLAARAHARLAALRALAWRVAVWPRASIGWSVKVIGWRDIEIGRNVVIGARSWLNVNHRGRGIALAIGDNAYIGTDNFFSTGRSIRLGEYVLTTSRCAFIGSSHVYSDPAAHYAGTGTTDDAVIDVGVNCFIGFGATIQGNVRVGHGSVIGAHSVVRTDIPPFSVAMGNPARVVRHHDFAAGRWVEGERPAGAPFPAEADYLAALRTRAGFPIQPISAAAASFGDI